MQSPTQIGWTAGIVDGEGCISAYGQKRRRGGNKVWSLRLMVANTDVRMVCRLQELWGGKVRKHNKPTSSKHNQAWLWEVCGQDAVAVLSALMGDLVCKREQAQLAIEFGELLGTPGGCKVGEVNIQRREELSGQLKLAKVVG